MSQLLQWSCRQGSKLICRKNEKIRLDQKKLLITNLQDEFLTVLAARRTLVLRYCSSRSSTVHGGAVQCTALRQKFVQIALPWRHAYIFVEVT